MLQYCPGRCMVINFQLAALNMKKLIRKNYLKYIDPRVIGVPLQVVCNLFKKSKNEQARQVFEKIDQV